MTYIQRNQFLPENVMMRLITCIRDSQIKPRDHLHTNFLGCLGEKTSDFIVMELGRGVTYKGPQECKTWELDSSLLYTLTTNTFVPTCLKITVQKKKKNQWILLSFLALVSSNYSFEKVRTSVIMSPAYLVTSTQKPWPWRIHSEFR